MTAYAAGLRAAQCVQSRVRGCDGQDWAGQNISAEPQALVARVRLDRPLFSSRSLFESAEFVSPVHARTSGSQLFGAAPGAMQGGSRQCSMCRFHVDVVYLLARCPCASHLVGSAGAGRGRVPSPQQRSAGDPAPPSRRLSYVMLCYVMLSSPILTQPYLYFPFLCCCLYYRRYRRTILFA